MGKRFFLDRQFLNLKGTVVLFCWSSMSKRLLPQGKVCLQFKASAAQSLWKLVLYSQGWCLITCLIFECNFFQRKWWLGSSYILICIHSILLSMCMFWITLIQAVWFQSNTIGLHYVVKQYLRLNHRIFAIFRTFFMRDCNNLIC